MKLRNYLAAIAVAISAWGPAAQADPIGPVCSGGSCWGGTYQLIYQLLSPNHYLFGIVASLGANTLPAGTTIEAVAFKVTSSTDSILSALMIGTNAAGVWDPTPNIGGLNNNGCSDGEAAFICSSHLSGPGQLVDTNTLLGWVFDVTLKPGEEWKLTTASLKIDFSGNGHLLSEPITAQPGIPVINPQCIPAELCVVAVPEPAPLALIAVALVAAGVARRRKS